MSYLQLHNNYKGHPKTKRLCIMLKDPRAWDYPVSLWMWAWDYAKDGNLDRYDVAEIEAACDWLGDEGALIEALIACRFIDRTDDGLVVHDWEDWQGKYIARAAADAKRKADARAKAKGVQAPRANALETPRDVVETSTVVHTPSAGHDADGVTLRPDGAPTPQAVHSGGADGARSKQSKQIRTEQTEHPRAPAHDPSTTGKAKRRIAIMCAWHGNEENFGDISQDGDIDDCVGCTFAKHPDPFRMARVGGATAHFKRVEEAYLRPGPPAGAASAFAVCADAFPGGEQALATRIVEALNAGQLAEYRNRDIERVPYLRNYIQQRAWKERRKPPQESPPARDLDAAVAAERKRVPNPAAELAKFKAWQAEQKAAGGGT